jgi:hypothetical protein
VTTTNATTTWSGTSPAQVQLQQYPTITQPTNPIQRNTQTEEDAFWLNNTLDDDFFTSRAANVMNPDTSGIVTQDFWLDTPNEEAIDWAQWDAWLVNPDSGHVNFGGGG